MKYSAVIRVRAGEDLIRCFEPEEKVKNRSSYTVSKNGEEIEFKIEAEDSVALRATINTITRLLTVWEKT